MVLAPSLTRMLKALQRRNLVTLRKDKADGRCTLISTTAMAQAVINAIAPESAQIYRELEAGFGAREMTRLLDLLEAVAKIPDKITP